MLVKLCGFSEEISLKSAIKYGCDFVGFVFYEQSPRNISISKALELSSLIPANIHKVAVVVKPCLDFLDKIALEFSPDYIQFHGNEDVDYLERFKQKFPKIKIIKAFSISCFDDLNRVEDFENVVDLFLFDSKVAGEVGGSGKSFDWTILNSLKTSKMWFLSGGLNKDNLAQAVKTTGAKMIDISSAIEEKKGVKSSLLIEDLTKFIQNNLK